LGIKVKRNISKKELERIQRHIQEEIST